MMIAVVDTEGKILLRKRLSNDISLFLAAVAKYRGSLAVAVESTFNWMWFVDACRDNGVSVYLGHTAHMRLIYGTKHKSDRLDAVKIAELLRAGLLPMAYAYPAAQRDVRDLLRYRMWLVQHRASILGRTCISLQQHAYLDTCKLLDTKKGRATVAGTLHNPYLRQMVEVGVRAVSELDKHIAELTRSVEQHAHEHLQWAYELLLEVPGMGRILALSVLYEIDTIERFKRRQDFCSYCRLVKPLHTSEGKTVGGGNRKCGNSYLKWAFMQVVTGAIRSESRIRQRHEQLKQRFCPLKARAILANHICTCVYYMLKHRQPFDLDRFCGPDTMQGVDSPGQRPAAAKAA
jgi:transposase